MTTEKYLSYFFPFDKIDFVKKGMESSWSTDDEQTPAISKHLKNIFEQGELREKVVVSKMEIPTPHGAIPGKTQLSPTNYYNLDAIISVGYRVNSIQATRFRIWATGILKEYIIKGFAMDDERLKQASIKFGVKFANGLIKKIPGKVLTKINQKVGFRFVTKFGTKGIVNLGKLLPGVGAVVGGGLDFVETKMIANRSYKWFFKHDFSVDNKNEEDIEIYESDLNVSVEEKE